MGDVMVRPSAGVPAELSVEDMQAQVTKIQTLMKAVMRDGEHYGVIPGTDKPALLKAGAEKLGFVFRHLPRFDIQRFDLPGAHREYTVTCTLEKPDGSFVGQGVGSCSTMETKYRYRNVAEFEDTGEPIPSDSRERKAEYRKQGFGMKKINGAWAWVKYGDTQRTENPDLADTYNTVLKMAKKRALVDAEITACAASDIFTQDVEQEEQAEAPPPANPEHFKIKEQLDRVATFAAPLSAEKKAEVTAKVKAWAAEGREGKLTQEQYIENLKALADELEGEIPY